jgi:hypothetical protein
MRLPGVDFNTFSVDWLSLYKSTYSYCFLKLIATFALEGSTF